MTSLWASAYKLIKPLIQPPLVKPVFNIESVDWDNLITLDFETYYSSEYTLRKLSTSEYIRDLQFEILMMGIKIGNDATRIIEKPNVEQILKSIDWAKSSLLCHHTQFDGFILSHYFGIQPKKRYCTLSMARALHGSEISAGLDAVSKFYGGYGKTLSGTADFKEMSFDLLKADSSKWANTSIYCTNDVDETIRIFKEMLPKLPKEEIDLINLTVQLFTDPVLVIDMVKVQKELEREQNTKKQLLLSLLNTTKELATEELYEAARKKIGSNESYAQLLRDRGVEPPIKKSVATGKNIYAFAKSDLEFMDLLEHPNPEIQELANLRLSVKSTLNETRAERFLKAGKNGWRLPVYLSYSAAHTLRWGGGNKMNMQNLERKGELRRSIIAPPGYLIAAVDSSQIEARVNAWLWGQKDLLEAFKASDAGTEQDVYCKFANLIYNRIITPEDSLERFVGKVCILGLGFQMGAAKLQLTLASGLMGPPVVINLEQCVTLVQKYRIQNKKITKGWDICKNIINDMAIGTESSFGPIGWSKNTIWLPNGLQLKYPGLHYDMSEGNSSWFYTRKDKSIKIYGGLLCENIVQALARLIIAWQMLKIAEIYRVVMMTHDEIIALIPAEEAKEALANMIEIMRQPPPWCSNIPLNAEGKVADYYPK